MCIRDRVSLGANPQLLATGTRPSTPTRLPLTVSPPAKNSAEQILSTPTPDRGRILPTPRQDADQYQVQVGDTLGIIAQRYGISIDTLMQANNISDPNFLEVGMTLSVPAPDPSEVGSSFKVIPDSEMVYGPASIYFDVNAVSYTHLTLPTSDLV